MHQGVQGDEPALEQREDRSPSDGAQDRGAAAVGERGDASRDAWTLSQVVPSAVVPPAVVPPGRTGRKGRNFASTFLQVEATYRLAA